MKRILGLFLVIFAMVSGSFFFTSCSSPAFLWCTSNGIIEYNRHTGQFEMIWEAEHKQANPVHDTIYVSVDSLSKLP